MTGCMQPTVGVLDLVEAAWRRESLAAIPDTSISGRHVARELTALIERRGKQGIIVSDNGTELASNAVFAWAHDDRVVWRSVAPGKPMQNGFCESFDGRACPPPAWETLLLGWIIAVSRVAELEIEQFQTRGDRVRSGLSPAGGRCRQSLRNTRSSAQPRPAPPIACCSTRAPRRKTRRGSNRRWMKNSDRQVDRSRP